MTKKEIIANFKEKQIVADLMFRMLVMGEGRTGNPYAVKEIKDVLTMLNGNEGKEFPAGKESEAWGSDAWRQYASAEIVREHLAKFAKQ